MNYPLPIQMFHYRAILKVLLGQYNTFTSVKLKIKIRYQIIIMISVINKDQLSLNIKVYLNIFKKSYFCYSTINCHLYNV